MRGDGRQLSLPDGRRLGYDDLGPPGGEPIFLFHGTPSSRLGWQFFGSPSLPQQLQIRLIAPDRPGIGLSDLQPGRLIGAWPADVARLADALGLERFAVLGYSGGGPYALACAREIPERLTAAGIVGGTGPYDVPGATVGIEPAILRFVSLARDSPELSEAIYSLMGALVRHAPHWLVARALAVLPRPDCRALAPPRLQHALVRTFLEAVRSGPRGVQQDTALLVSPWGFDPREVAMPVHLWQGEEDRFVSPTMVRYLIDALPQARPRFYPGEGHVSLLVHHAEGILTELLS